MSVALYPPTNLNASPRLGMVVWDIFANPSFETTSIPFRDMMRLLRPFHHGQPKSYFVKPHSGGISNGILATPNRHNPR